MPVTWMVGSISSFTPDTATRQELDTLLSASSIAHWRVVARDAYGNRKTTETRSFTIIPPITLVSPANGSRFDTNEGFPVFVWESSYIQFKIQFSTVSSFEGNTLTFPESNDAWLNEPSITLDRTQEGEIKKLLQNIENELLYWRVLAQDSYGNVEISETRRLFVSR